MQKREQYLHDNTVHEASLSDVVEIFDKLNMGVLRFDDSFHLMYANPLASETLQKPLKELEGRHLRDIVPAAIAGHLLEGLKRAHRENSTVSFDVQCTKEEPVWLHCRCTPTKEGITIFFEDITELKNAQESLKKANEDLEQRVQERTKHLKQTSRMLEEQKELLLTIIDNIPVMLTFNDPSGAVRLINREFERLVGWSLEEARSMNMIAACYPDPKVRKEVWEFMMKAKPGWKDLELTTRSGKVLDSSWANVRLSDGSQIGIGIDISSRKKMEQSLLRLVGAIEQADEGIMILNPEWEIDYVNQAYESLSGFERHDLIGKPVTFLESYFIDSSYQEIIRTVKRESKAWSGRQKREKPSGEIIEINLTVSPVYNKEGSIINYVFLARDITEEIKFQQRLLQMQKMEALGNLAGGIANNLKNAFTPILIDTEVLMEDTGKRDSSYPILEEIMQATYYGIDLVKHLLMFSRRTPQQKKPLDVVPIVQEALKFLRASLPSTIEIHDRLNAEKAMILADPTQIKQALINLSSNAGDFMEKQGGTLDVELSGENLDVQSAARISPDLAPGSYVRIKVKDTGKGMDAEDMEHIFEPFFTKKGRDEGLGLGLSIVHGIVKAHNGAVTVESSPGKGTTFTVLLPRLQEKAA